MLYARDELRLEKRVGLWGPAVCFVLVLIAVTLLARDALGQESATVGTFDLVGTVVDAENGQALVGAFVSLTGSEWGSVTDEGGRFAIRDVFEGRISISAEQLGYERLVWDEEVVANGGLLELRMVPQPLVLAGLRVVTDRFESRRKASPTTVIAFDREDLATTSQRTVLDFVAQRVGTSREPCISARGGDVCLRVRGRTVESSVYVDEAPVIGGLSYLDILPPYELQMVEVFGNGRHIRAYTTRFMERAAKIRLQPLALLF